KGTGAERRNESPYAQRMRAELEALQAQADAYYANQEEMARRAKAIAEDANAPVTGGTVTNPTGTGGGGGNTRTTATKELASATRELTAAEQEALAYQESLNAVGEETLRQRGQTSMAILEQQ